MGYIVPAPPSAIITLPLNTTYANYEALRDWYAGYPQMVTLPPADPMLISGWKPDDPRGWTERNVTALGYGLLASVGALVLFLAAIIAGEGIAGV